MATVTVTSTKVVDMKDIKAVIVQHHNRVSKVEIARMRGLIRDGDAINEMIAADMEMEICLAKLLGVRKWDAED